MAAAAAGATGGGSAAVSSRKKAIEQLIDNAIKVDSFYKASLLRDRYLLSGQVSESAIYLNKRNALVERLKGMLNKSNVNDEYYIHLAGWHGPRSLMQVAIAFRDFNFLNYLIDNLDGKFNPTAIIELIHLYYTEDDIASIQNECIKAIAKLFAKSGKSTDRIKTELIFLIKEYHRDDYGNDFDLVDIDGLVNPVLSRIPTYLRRITGATGGGSALSSLAARAATFNAGAESNMFNTSSLAAVSAALAARKAHINANNEPYEPLMTPPASPEGPSGRRRKSRKQRKTRRRNKSRKTIV